MPKRHDTPEMIDLRNRFSARLVASMENKNISGVEFALAIGVSVSTVSDWRNERSLPSGENLARMSIVLNERTSFLMGDRMPGRDSIYALSHDLSSRLGSRRIQALAQMEPTWLLREIDRLVGSYIAQVGPLKTQPARTNRGRSRKSR